MATQMCIVGTVATDPKVVVLPSGATLCSFRLACSERRFNRDANEWVDGETNWFTINAFRGIGAHAAGSFAQGDRVIINGKLRVRNWENGERSGTSVEVEAEALGHDLRWGTSQFTKTIQTRSADQDATDIKPSWSDPSTAINETNIAEEVRAPF